MANIIGTPRLITVDLSDLVSDARTPIGYIGRAVTWKELAALVPELARLRRRALRFRRFDGPVFCANAVWYGGRGYGGHSGIRPEIIRLVGDATTHPSRVVRSSEAYDLVYETLYELLPDCRGECACAGGYGVPELVPAVSRARKARRLAGGDPEDVRAEWQAMQRTVAPLIFERDGYRCTRCLTADNLTVDHIVPIDAGGANSLANMQTLCRSCNSSKGARWGKDA